MTVESLLAIYQALSSAGFPFMLFVALVGNQRRVYYWRWQYDELAKDRDQWKALALNGTQLAERIAKVKGR